MNILALDPSIRKIGWACLSVGMQAPDFGTLALPEVGRRYDKFLVPARDWLVEKITSEEITDLVFEAPWLGRNVKTLRTVSALDGMIELVCHDMGVRCSEVAPSSWRSKTIGVTAAPKHIKKQKDRTDWLKCQAMAWCRDRGHPIKTDDEAEALCILAYKRGLEDDGADFDSLPLGAAV